MLLNLNPDPVPQQNLDGHTWDRLGQWFPKTLKKRTSFRCRYSGCPAISYKDEFLDGRDTIVYCKVNHVTAPVSSTETVLSGIAGIAEFMREEPSSSPDESRLLPWVTLLSDDLEGGEVREILVSNDTGGGEAQDTLLIDDIIEGGEVRETLLSDDIIEGGEAQETLPRDIGGGVAVDEEDWLTIWHLGDTNRAWKLLLNKVEVSLLEDDSFMRKFTSRVWEDGRS